MPTPAKTCQYLVYWHLWEKSLVGYSGHGNGRYGHGHTTFKSINSSSFDHSTFCTKPYCCSLIIGYTYSCTTTVEL